MGSASKLTTLGRMRLTTRRAASICNTTSNPWDLKYDKGSGSLDRRNILNINYTYKLPFFAHSSGLTHSSARRLGNLRYGDHPSPVFPGRAATPRAAATRIRWDWAAAIPTGANLAGKPKYVKAKATVGTNTGYQWVSNAGFSQPTAAWNGGPNLGFGNEGRDCGCRPRPHQLHHIGVQVVCLYRARSLRASRGQLQYLQPHPVQRVQQYGQQQQLWFRDRCAGPERIRVRRQVHFLSRIVNRGRGRHHLPRPFSCRILLSGFRPTPRHIESIRGVESFSCIPEMCRITTPSELKPNRRPSGIDCGRESVMRLHNQTCAISAFSAIAPTTREVIYEVPANSHG